MNERMGMGQSRELGDELRQYRELAGIPGHVLAERLGWSASKVSRIETGNSSVTEIDVVRYAAHCGVVADGIDALLTMCREPGTPGYWMSHRLSTLVLHETTAESSSSYHPLVVPGLLQTEEYATALISAERLAPGLTQVGVQARMERQRVLPRHDFEFFIHEYALRLPVGGDRVMNEQLLKLVLLAEQPRLTIRVAPAVLGAQSVFGGSFELFRYAQHRPLIHLDSVGLFLEDPDQVATYQEKLNWMSEIALGREESREVLAALASEFDQPEDSRDLAKEQLQ